MAPRRPRRLPAALCVGLGGSGCALGAAAGAWTNASEAGGGPAASEYEVIVVGAGLVGAALASRLAELRPGGRVLLLEAGGPSHQALGGADLPASWSKGEGRWKPWPSAGALGGLTRYDVPGNYEALQCWDRSCRESWGKAVPYFQCKILGGCGVMNGALMQIPHEGSFADLPEGWRFGDFKKYFDEVQRLFTLTALPSMNAVHYMERAGGGSFVKQVLQAKGFKETSALEVRDRTFATPVVTASKGVRQSTASVMLPKAKGLKNFELLTGCEVLRIEHRNGAASAVVFRGADGAQHRAAVSGRGVVVLTAGALNSPRLLLASGLDGGGSVGVGLTDHTLQFTTYQVPEGGADGSFESLAPPPYDAIMRYAEARSGPLAQFGPVLTAFLKAPGTPGGGGVYDVELWVNPLSQRGMVHISAVLMRPRCPAATLSVGGDGNGRVAGALHAGCKLDKDVLSWAMGEIDAMMASKGGKRMYISSPDAMSHFAGTCKLGACVSPENLRLKGTTNVAVADASILGTVWGHPAMTLTALGLKAADVLAASL